MKTIKQKEIKRITAATINRFNIIGDKFSKNVESSILPESLSSQIIDDFHIFFTMTPEKRSDFISKTELLSSEIVERFFDFLTSQKIYKDKVPKIIDIFENVLYCYSKGRLSGYKLSLNISEDGIFDILGNQNALKKIYEVSERFRFSRYSINQNKQEAKQLFIQDSLNILYTSVTESLAITNSDYSESVKYIKDQKNIKILEDAIKFVSNNQSSELTFVENIKSNIDISKRTIESYINKNGNIPGISIPADSDFLTIIQSVSSIFGRDPNLDTARLISRFKGHFDVDIVDTVQKQISNTEIARLIETLPSGDKTILNALSNLETFLNFKSYIDEKVKTSGLRGIEKMYSRIQGNDLDYIAIKNINTFLNKDTEDYLFKALISSMEINKDNFKNTTNCLACINVANYIYNRFNNEEITDLQKEKYKSVINILGGFSRVVGNEKSSDDDLESFLTIIQKEDITKTDNTEVITSFKERISQIVQIPIDKVEPNTVKALICAVSKFTILEPKDDLNTLIDMYFSQAVNGKIDKNTINLSYIIGVIQGEDTKEEKIGLGMSDSDLEKYFLGLYDDHSGKSYGSDERIKSIYSGSIKNMISVSRKSGYLVRFLSNDLSENSSDSDKEKLSFVKSIMIPYLQDDELILLSGLKNTFNYTRYSYLIPKIIITLPKERQKEVANLLPENIRDGLSILQNKIFTKTKEIYDMDPTMVSDFLKNGYLRSFSFYESVKFLHINRSRFKNSDYKILLENLKNNTAKWEKGTKGSDILESLVREGITIPANFINDECFVELINRGFSDSINGVDSIKFKERVTIISDVLGANQLKIGSEEDIINNNAKLVSFIVNAFPEAKLSEMYLEKILSSVQGSRYSLSEFNSKLDGISLKEVYRKQLFLFGDFRKQLLNSFNYSEDQKKYLDSAFLSMILSIEINKAFEADGIIMNKESGNLLENGITESYGSFRRGLKNKRIPDSFIPESLRDIDFGRNIYTKNNALSTINLLKNEKEYFDKNGDFLNSEYLVAKSTYSFYESISDISISDSEFLEIKSLFIKNKNLIDKFTLGVFTVDFITKISFYEYINEVCNFIETNLEKNYSDESDDSLRDRDEGAKYSKYLHLKEVYGKQLFLLRDVLKNNYETAIKRIDSDIGAMLLYGLGSLADFSLSEKKNTFVGSINSDGLNIDAEVDEYLRNSSNDSTVEKSPGIINIMRLIMSSKDMDGWYNSKNKGKFDSFLVNPVSIDTERTLVIDDIYKVFFDIDKSPRLSQAITSGDRIKINSSTYKFLTNISQKFLKNCLANSKKSVDIGYDSAQLLSEQVDVLTKNIKDISSLRSFNELSEIELNNKIQDINYPSTPVPSSIVNDRILNTNGFLLNNSSVLSSINSQSFIENCISNDMDEETITKICDTFLLGSGINRLQFLIALKSAIGQKSFDIVPKLKNL